MLAWIVLLRILGTCSFQMLQNGIHYERSVLVLSNRKQTVRVNYCAILFKWYICKKSDYVKHSKIRHGSTYALILHFAIPLFWSPGITLLFIGKYVFWIVVCELQLEHSCRFSVLVLFIVRTCWCMILFLYYWIYVWDQETRFDITAGMNIPIYSNVHYNRGCGATAYNLHFYGNQTTAKLVWIF